MKHILLGTTALVAAGLMAGPAAAQQGVQLGLGGYYFGAAGGNIDEDFDDAPDDVRDYAFKQDLEVHVRGEATLDNGLTVGARVEIEGQQSGDQIDEVFAYFSGGFGEIRFGDDDDAYAQLCYLVPTASGAFGADSPFLNFSNAGVVGYGATNGTCYGLSDNSTKLIYFTPSFGGFQLAASFAPENTEDRRNTLGVFGTAPDNNDPGDPDQFRGSIENIWSLAGTYATELNGFSVALGGGAAFGKLESDPTGCPGADDPKFYNAYAQVGFAGWTIGGATEIRNNAVCDGDSVVYGAGATYGFEAWTVGLGWTRGEYDNVQGPDTEDTYDIIQFTAAYALGPGVTVDALVGYNKYDSDGGNDYDGIEAGIGFGINF